MQAVQEGLRRADRVQRRRPILAFPLAVVKKFGEDRAGQLAALIAYYGFFSLFPLLLALVTLTGLVLSGSDLQGRVVDAALAQFPVVGDELQRNLRTLPGKGVGLAIGLGGAIWAGLGGIKAAQNAMDQIWDVPMKRQPSFFLALFRAVLMLATLGVFILFASFLGGVAAGTSEAGLFLRAAGILGSLALNFLIFLVALRVLTVEDVSWGDVWVGAAIGAVGWSALQGLGGYLIGHRMESAAETYGFFAIVIALLTWIYLGAQLTLFAAEVNVVRARRLWPRALDPKAMTAADERALRAHAAVEERRPEEEVRVGFNGSDATVPRADGAATTGGDGHGMQGGAATRSDARRLPTLVRSIASDLSLLARQQTELAKQELGEMAGTKAKGAGLLGAAGVLGLFVLGFLGLAGAAALDLVLPRWAALLIVGGGYLLLAAVLGLAGRGALRAKRGPEETKRTVKEDVEWAKRQLRR
jgi:YihY family inner membrane protein